MTRLVSFHIEGLAGLDKALEVKVGSLAIFWGLNGAGKTTLLRILHAALSNESGSIRRAPFRKAEVSFYSTNHERLFTRSLSKEPRTLTGDQRELDTLDEIDLVLSNAPDPSVRQSMEGEVSWKTAPKMRSTATPGSMRHSYLPTSRLEAEGESRALAAARRRAILRDQGSELGYEETFAKVIDDLWVRLANEALNAQQRVARRGIADIMSLSVTGITADEAFDTPFEIPPNEAYEIFSRFMHDQGMPVNLNKSAFIKRYTREEVQRQIISSIVRLNQYMREATKSLDALFDLVNRMFSGSKQLVRSPRHLGFQGDSGEEIPLSSMSSGEKQLVYLLLTCMRAEDNLVLIDEPELSLHVDWQQALIEAIRTVNPNVQLIMATHSPEIMADVPDECIFQL